MELALQGFLSTKLQGEYAEFINLKIAVNCCFKKGGKYDLQ